MIIAILAAMDKELALLRNLLENETIEQLDKLTVYIGSIAGHGIILSKCGIGKVNAALNTYRIIQNFHPELVINCGVAGGAGGLHVGDLLAAGAVAYHDVWCGPGTQPGNADACPAIFEPYAPVIDIARNRLAGEHTSFGLIATGDIFISKKRRWRMSRRYILKPWQSTWSRRLSPMSAIRRVCPSI